MNWPTVTLILGALALFLAFGYACLRLASRQRAEDAERDVKARFLERLPVNPAEAEALRNASGSFQ